ncbi:MAG: helix-turn-helix domain-containing protein [Lentisphaerae bacterium]|nr:helix-turn-helix domain-containing protein [Lentisphaerota bacterium]
MAVGKNLNTPSAVQAPGPEPTPGQPSSASALNHPSLQKLDELSRQLLDIGLAVVLPHAKGWEHLWLSGNGPWAPYCRLFLRHAEGAKQCKMCHILMAVAACTQGIREHRCHTGASVLVAPVQQPHGEAAAVLSNCVFFTGKRANIWPETRERGKKLGLDLKKLRKEFLALPEPTAEKKALAHLILETAAQMAAELSRRRLLEQELNKLRNRVQGKEFNPSAVERILNTAMKMPSNHKPATAPPARHSSQSDGGRHGAAHGAPEPDSNGKTPPAIVKVVKNLVNHRPDLNFCVTEIARAARLSPNYFSALFRRYADERFSDFLLNRRIELAQKYLRDKTLNVSEVAFKVGFDDPGYFIRRFKRRVGLTPGAWRSRLA